MTCTHHAWVGAAAGSLLSDQAPSAACCSVRVPCTELCGGCPGPGRAAESRGMGQEGQGFEGECPRWQGVLGCWSRAVLICKPDCGAALHRCQRV